MQNEEIVDLMQILVLLTIHREVITRISWLQQGKCYSTPTVLTAREQVPVVISISQVKDKHIEQVYRYVLPQVLSLMRGKNEL